ADVAPIDSYAYSLLQKYRRDLTSHLRVIGRTARTPIPPLVGAKSVPAVLQAAFLEAHAAASLAPLMQGLLLERFVCADADAYDALRLNYEAATRYWREHRLAATVHPAFAATPIPLAR